MIIKLTIEVAGKDKEIMVSANRIENDFSGNPQYLLQVYSMQNDSYGTIWYPKLPGFRDRKDQSYKVQSYSIMQTINTFADSFESYINSQLRTEV
ncbi:hypothetical protein Bfsp1_31 [Cytobacillus phage Bfsp1]|nr:hypothetical protein Bfsp1_31 [Cytobacillus phage Bfsp1]